MITSKLSQDDSTQFRSQEQHQCTRAVWGAGFLLEGGGPSVVAAWGCPTRKPEGERGTRGQGGAQRVGGGVRRYVWKLKVVPAAAAGAALVTADWHVGGSVGGSVRHGTDRIQDTLAGSRRHPIIMAWHDGTVRQCRKSSWSGTKDGQRVVVRLGASSGMSERREGLAWRG